VLNYTKGIAATGGFSPVELGAMKKIQKMQGVDGTPRGFGKRNPKWVGASGNGGRGWGATS